MVKHVSIGDECICFEPINYNSKDPTRNHHAHFTVLLEGENSVFWYLLGNQIVVLLDILYFLTYLLLEGTSFKPCSLFFSVEDWEIVKIFRQDVHVWVEVRRIFPPLLH